MLSRITYTPISFWLDMPLHELIVWIREQNAITREIEAERKKKT